MLLTACALPAPPPTPTSLPTPTSTFTPSPTPIPSPTPTATPIPSLGLTIRWPEQVSALQPVPVEVDLVPPPGASVTSTVSVRVLDPYWKTGGRFDLAPQGGDRYAAEEPLQLPLEAAEGDWRLIVYVSSTLPVAGQRWLAFRPTSVRFHDLSGVLPEGVSVRVPQDFVERVAQGDPTAGGRVWRYGDGEIALWWAPGPVEPLLLNTAVVMIEATFDPEAPPAVRHVEETEWQSQAAFLFHEDWPEDQVGTNSGPAEALVVQGPDYRLYVLRIRALGTRTIPPLLHQVRNTFAFIEQEQ